MKQAYVVYFNKQLFAGQNDLFHNFHMLCISSSFWVLRAPKSWSNYFFQPFSSFLVHFKGGCGSITLLNLINSLYQGFDRGNSLYQKLWTLLANRKKMQFEVDKFNFRFKESKNASLSKITRKIF